MNKAISYLNYLLIEMNPYEFSDVLDDEVILCYSNSINGINETHSGFMNVFRIYYDRLFAITRNVKIKKVILELLPDDRVFLYLEVSEYKNDILVNIIDESYLTVKDDKITKIEMNIKNYTEAT